MPARDDKSVILTLGGYCSFAKTNGADNTINQLSALVEHGPDCALVTYGILKGYREALDSVPVVLHADNTVSVLDNTVPNIILVFSAGDALKVAAEGVVCITFLGAFSGKRTHITTVQPAQAADRWDVPLIVGPPPYGYPVTNDDSNNPVTIATLARAVVELDADAVKTRFIDSSENRLIVGATGVPALALGGLKTGIDGYFKSVQRCVQTDVKGVAVGRSATRDPQPAGVVADLNAIIHKNATVEDAHSLYMAR